MRPIAKEYIEHGLALVSIPSGRKGPITTGWNRPENAITSLDKATALTGNIGLLHAYSSPLTMALDIDHLAAATTKLSKYGIDLQGLLSAPDAVQICSGRADRAKLLYRLPEGLEALRTIQVTDAVTKEMIYELRCVSSNGLSMQDVLPPSIHPDTGKPYTWGGAGHFSRISTIPSALLSAWRELANGSEDDSAPPKSVPGVVEFVSQLTVQHLRSALLHTRSDSRELWVKAGMALKSLGEAGRGMWLEWSTTSEKYEAMDAATTWESFQPTAIDHKYIFAEAQRQGWVNPAKTFESPPDLLPQDTEFLQGAGVHLDVGTPRKLPPALKNVDKLPVDALPSAIRDAAVDMAERLQCPIDYLAVAMLSAAGTILGNQVGIYPMAKDESWEVYPCLWGGIVGSPGTKKTPALNAALAPLHYLESEAARTFMQATTLYKIALNQHTAALANLKKVKGTGLVPPEPVEPKQERYMVHDTTYQALGAILANNPRGVLALSDELSGLLQSLDTQGQEAARGFFLTGWGGTSGYSFDRIGRGSTVLQRYCLSVFGGFQPDRIKGYVKFAQRGSSQNDGLMQRFQLLVWPDPTKTFKIVDRTPNKAAIDAFNKAMLNLDVIAKAPMNGVLPGRYGQKILHFSADAQALFNSWLLQNEQLLGNEKMDSARQSHFSKYRSLIPALALLFHLLDGKIGPVPEKCIQSAITFAFYLKSHANRVYASVSGHDFACTRSLAMKLLGGALPSGFTNRTIVMKGWAGLTSSDVVQSSLAALVEYGWLEEREKKGSVGRGTVAYFSNAGISSELLGIS